MRNMAPPGNTRENALLDRAIRLLAEQLPIGWKVDWLRGGLSSAERRRGEAKLTIRGPDRRRATIQVEAKLNVSPKWALEKIRHASGSGPREPLLLVSPYLSPSVRERIRRAGLSYLDLTGNTFVSLESPGLVLALTGAGRDPERRGRIAKSLKGPKAGRVVRVLVESARIPGVRELAQHATVDPGYVSRLLKLLDEEALIERRPDGKTERVDWQALLRRWATDAPLESRGNLTRCLEPRGLKNLMDKLIVSRLKYALTGTLAAIQWAPIAPARLAVIYVANLEEALGRLALREVDDGANVWLIEPNDDFVFTKVIRTSAAPICAAHAQVAADLLSGPGRNPVEGEALLAWMASHEGAWRG